MDLLEPFSPLLIPQKLKEPLLVAVSLIDWGWRVGMEGVEAFREGAGLGVGM